MKRSSNIQWATNVKHILFDATSSEGQPNMPLQENTSFDADCVSLISQTTLGIYGPAIARIAECADTNHK